jgi:hypothetical protein
MPSPTVTGTLAALLLLLAPAAMAAQAAQPAPAPAPAAEPAPASSAASAPAMPPASASAPVQVNPSAPATPAATASTPESAVAPTPSAGTTPAGSPAAPPAAGSAPAGAPGKEGGEPYLPPKHNVADIDPLGTRLVNVATPVTVGARGLELLITHRFRLPVQQGSSSDLYGLDSGADVGIGISGGIGRNLDLSFYRSSFEADYELAAKLRVLRQGAGMPLSLAVRAGADLPGLAGVRPHTRPFAQVLLSTRLAPHLNLLVSPSWVQDTPRLHNAYNVPVGLTLPLGRGAEIDLEAIPRNGSLHGSQTAWHAALSKQVGWHIFKIVVGNSRATTVDQMLGGDSETGFRNRDVRLGFNLIRYFFY